MSFRVALVNKSSWSLFGILKPKLKFARVIEADVRQIFWSFGLVDNVLQLKFAWDTKVDNWKRVSFLSCGSGLDIFPKLTTQMSENKGEGMKGRPKWENSSFAKEEGLQQKS